MIMSGETLCIKFSNLRMSTVVINLMFSYLMLLMQFEEKNILLQVFY